MCVQWLANSTPHALTSLAGATVAMEGPQILPQMWGSCWNKWEKHNHMG